MIDARLAFLLSCIPLLACASVPPVPGAGGDAWYEVRGSHFRVLSDLDREDAIEATRELERLLAAYLLVGWSARDFPEQLTVVVLRDAEEVERFRPGSQGFFISSALLEPLAVTPASQGIEGFEVLKHELSHHIAYASVPRQPPWFAEGIATFFQTGRFDAQGRFTIGVVPRGLHSVVAAQGVLPARTLLAEDVDTEGPRFYPSAWLLVHYLMMKRGEAFARYQQALNDGASFDTAWTDAFPELTPELLDRQLAQYLDRGTFENYSVPVDIAPVQTSVRALRDADVYAVRALIDVGAKGVPEWSTRARENLALALRSDPQHLQARLIELAYFDEPSPERLTSARAVAEQHPDAWLAWLMVASLENDTGIEPAQQKALDRALALKPDQPFALALAAQRASRLGDHTQARQLSARALRVAPFEPEVVVIRAMVLHHAGEAAHACALLDGARGRVHGRGNDAVERARTRLCAQP